MQTYGKEWDMNTQYKKGVLLLSFGVVPTVFVLLIIRGFFRRNQEQYRKFAAAGTQREAIA